MIRSSRILADKRILLGLVLLVAVTSTALMGMLRFQFRREARSAMIARAEDVARRVAAGVSPSVWNLYQQSMERRFTEETASAILDSELQSDFVRGILVYGNFGHLFMGRAVGTTGGIHTVSSEEGIPYSPRDSVYLPIRQGPMTIGNVRVFYDGEGYLLRSRRSNLSVSLVVLFFALLIVVALVLLYRAAKARIVTDNALISLRDAQGKLIQSEKLASMGSLVAGVAHEINTPLGVVFTANSYIREVVTESLSAPSDETGSQDRFKETAETILKTVGYSLNSIERVKNLINTFKQVSVDQMVDERRVVAIDDYVRELMGALNLELKKRQIRYEVACEGPTTMEAYPGAIAQIVTNLTTNSLHHGFEGRDSGMIRILLKGERNGGLMIIYEDDGKGMPAEVLERIYEPFFTTRRIKGGTGLGMHIVFNVVTHKLGGEISVESELDQGARFCITIPPLVDESGVGAG